jgi:chromosome segregation ATPase
VVQLIGGTMAAKLAFFFLLVLPVAAFQPMAISTLQSDMMSNATPVSKVVALLKDMQKQLEKEGEEDEETYEKFKCWCNTNDAEKTKSIKVAEARIADLTTSIEEGTATSARLNTEIANLEKEVAANQHALDQAAAMRTKDLAEFTAEEKDLLQSIGALKSAITVLAKHHGGAALLQISAGQLSQVALTLQHEMQKHAALLEGIISTSQKKKVAAFVADHSKYAPQSGEIFGILKAMKESFEQNLAGSRKDEDKDVKDFTDLKASKEEEIAAGKEQAETKTQELAATDMQLAQDKQDLDDTQASLTEDEKFLMNLKETCAMTDAEWEQRTKERQLEIEAVSKALAILSSDSAHDTFTKTFSPTLLQVERTSKSQRRENASKLLAQIAQKTGNPRLSALAVKVRLDAFKRVIKAIDDMIAELTKEKQDEIKHRDYCIANLNSNEADTERKDREKKDVLALIDDLTMTIDKLTKEIETLKSEIAEMQNQLKIAGEDRELENKEFQTVVADQRASQDLLKQALEVLKAVYAKKAAALLQKSKQAPPPGFKAYKKQSGGVLGMIQSIIDDAVALEKEAIRAEEESQKAYEDFVKDTNASIEEKTKEVVNKSEQKAKAEDDKVKAEESRDKILLDLEQLANENADLHKACDFVLKNFDIRQTARDEEVEALKQAKAILSGAKFNEFLQNGFAA